MTPEKMPLSFPGQEKIEEEAHEINKKVDEYYERPRTKKSSPADEVAHKIIKNQEDAPISLEKLFEKEILWYKNLLSCGIRFTNNGFLEISRWDDGERKKGEKKRIWQKIDGINSAIRMQDNILNRYRVDQESQKSEFSRLKSIEEVIEEANELMLEWKTAKDEEKKDLQTKLTQVVLLLEKCRNEFKVEVKDQSEAVMKMKDGLDRNNPSALAARTVAALNRLAGRMNEMQLIMPRVAMRKEALIFEKRRIENVLNIAVKRLLVVLQHEVFNENSKKPADSRIHGYEVEILNKEIGKALHLLGTVRALPYSKQAEQVRFCLANEAKINFYSKKKLLDNLDPAKKALIESIKILESNIEHLD